LYPKFSICIQKLQLLHTKKISSPTRNFPNTNPNTNF